MSSFTNRFVFCRVQGRELEASSSFSLSLSGKEEEEEDDEEKKIGEDHDLI